MPYEPLPLRLKPDTIVLLAETVIPYFEVETTFVVSGPFSDLRVRDFARVRVSL
jgi:hypothetical protein